VWVLRWPRREEEAVDEDEAVEWVDFDDDDDGDGDGDGDGEEEEEDDFMDSHDTCFILSLSLSYLSLSL